MSVTFVTELFSKNTVAPIKRDFNEKLQKVMSRRKSNSAFYLDSDRYADFIKDVTDTKLKINKDFYDYKMLTNYDVLEVNGRSRLIRPKDETCPSVKFYIPTDELFGVLHTMHLLLGHPGVDTMDLELKTKYCNISKEAIRLYISLCKTCNSKSQ